MKRRTFLKALSAMGAIAPLTTPNLARSQGTNVLKFVPQADLGVLDSVFTTAYVTRNHAFLVFDTLYGMTEAYGPNLRWSKATVSRMTASCGAQLREGLEFHDGQPVLARDVVASIKRWARARRARRFASRWRPTSSRRPRPEIRFRLKKPFPLLPLAFGRGSGTMAPIMPERLAMTPPTQQVTEMVEAALPLSSPASACRARLRPISASRVMCRAPTGTPSFTAGPKIANVERIEWHVIPDAATAAAALQAGEVDWWEQPTADLLPLLKRNPSIKSEIIDRAGNIGLMRLNCLYPPFDNPAVKQRFLAPSTRRISWPRSPARIRRCGMTKRASSPPRRRSRPMSAWTSFRRIPITTR